MHFKKTRQILMTLLAQLRNAQFLFTQLRMIKALDPAVQVKKMTTGDPRMVFMDLTDQ